MITTVIHIMIMIINKSDKNGVNNDNNNDNDFANNKRWR